MSFTDEKFKLIQAEWYALLKDTGFSDAESTHNGRDLLRVWHSSYFQNRYCPSSFVKKQEYYRMAGFFLHNHHFQNEVELHIWELHTQGLSLRKIAHILRTKICRIHKVIRDLTAKMKEETYDLTG
jgi:hypothetical protein